MSGVPSDEPSAEPAVLRAVRVYRRLSVTASWSVMCLVCPAGQGHSADLVSCNYIGLSNGPNFMLSAAFSDIGHVVVGSRYPPTRSSNVYPLIFMNSDLSSMP